MCWCACVCVCQKFINKGKERQRELLTFFPGGTRFWLVFRMCVRAFLMFFSFMLDSTAGGRNSDRPHSFLWREEIDFSIKFREGISTRPGRHTCSEKLEAGLFLLSDRLSVTQQKECFLFVYKMWKRFLKELLNCKFLCQQKLLHCFVTSVTLF